MEKRITNIMSNNLKKENIVGYVRSNTQDIVKIERQKQIISEFCKKYDIKCSKICIDYGFSGTNINRPAISNVIESKKIKIILVSNISIISRNYNDVFKITKELNKKIIGIEDNVIL